MSDSEKHPETLTDYITGRELPNTGAEENRQAVERFLVEKKGYDRDDIEVNVPISVTIQGEPYRSVIDLVLGIDEKRFMVIKCAAGSLGSREREIISAGRLLEDYQIPFSMVSDGTDAILIDTISGKTIGRGLDTVFDKTRAIQLMNELEDHPLPEEKRNRECLIFRSYDSMNVNRFTNF